MDKTKSFLSQLPFWLLAFVAFGFPAALVADQSSSSGEATMPQTIVPNDNRVPAGTLENGVLRLRLEICEGQWFPEAESGPSLKIQAFAEAGKQPQVPGPLIRVTQGTEVHATIHNALPSGTALLYGLHMRPAEREGGIEVPAGESREARFRLDAPGTYYYWASTTGEPLETREGTDGLLTAGLIVDSANGDKNDRVFVIGKWASPHPVGNPLRRVVFAINGKSWPHNEKLTHSIGDEVRWRWINTTNRSHPMHMHGSYFRIDSTGDGTRDNIYAAEDRRMAVTERMPIGGTMANDLGSRDRRPLDLSLPHTGSFFIRPWPRRAGRNNTSAFWIAPGIGSGDEGLSAGPYCLTLRASWRTGSEGKSATVAAVRPRETGNVGLPQSPRLSAAGGGRRTLAG